VIAAPVDETGISAEFLTFLAMLHDIISTYHTRLCEVTSPRVANQFLAGIADKAILDLRLDNDDFSSIENVKKWLNRMGIKLTTVNIGEGTECKIECPFATQVHPLLVSKNPICPIAIIVLGVTRSTRKGEIASMKTLTEKGSETVIRRPDEQG